MPSVILSDAVGQTVQKTVDFPSCRLRYFYDPLYLAVTCSAFACGVQNYGLF